MRIPPRNIDIDDRLGDSLRGVAYENAPLHQVLADLSQLSTIPIWLDADELADMGLSAETPVTVNLKDTTIEAALKETLSPHGLGWRTVNGQLLVGRAASTQTRQAHYDVADLSGDTPAGREQFAALVREMVDPESWKKGTGSASIGWSDGALVVEQTESSHARLLAFCERLRLARRQPLKTHDDGGRYQLEPRSAQAKEILSQRVTLHYGRPESLARILNYLRTTTHVNLLVDGPALAGEQMSVETEGSLSADNQPLSQALAALLEPMELTYRAIDAHTLLITTTRTAARHAEIEFYPVGELLTAGASGDDLAARLQRELAEKAPSDSPQTAALFRFDRPSRTLIVRAPQSIQSRVQALLDDWRVAGR